MSRNHQEHTYGKRVRTLRRLRWVLGEVRAALVSEIRANGSDSRTHSGQADAWDMPYTKAQAIRNYSFLAGQYAI